MFWSSAVGRWARPSPGIWRVTPASPAASLSSSATRPTPAPRRRCRRARSASSSPRRSTSTCRATASASCARRPELLGVDLGLKEPGYLFLASEAGEAVLRANHAVQKGEGCAVELLDPAALRVPLSLDLRRGRPARLARRRQRRLVRRSGPDAGLPPQGARARRAVRRRRGREAGAQRRHPALGRHGRGPDDRAGRRPVVGRGRRHGRHRAAGRAAPPLGVRVRCPRAARPDAAHHRPSGTWFRPEGRFYIGGTTPAAGNDPPGAPLEVQHQEWDDMVWPALAARVPAFEAAKVVNRWAGYYEYNTFDQNGIVGRHPGDRQPDLRHRLFRPRHPAVARRRPRRRRADRAWQLSHARSLALRL